MVAKGQIEILRPSGSDVSGNGVVGSGKEKGKEKEKENANATGRGNPLRVLIGPEMEELVDVEVGLPVFA